MSLILDALKKSEQERQRDRAPGLQSIHQPSTRREIRSVRPGWWLLGLVAVNVVALGYWFWQKPATASAAQTVQTQPATVSVAPPPAEAAPQAAVRSEAQPPTDASAEYTHITPAGSPRPAAAANATALPPIQEVGELPDDVRNNLPAMTFSFHVYSANPEQRTIIINNRRVRAGDEVASGLQLQEITEDGVILGFAGHRIHIGVLNGW